MLHAVTLLDGKGVVARLALTLADKEAPVVPTNLASERERPSGTATKCEEVEKHEMPLKTQYKTTAPTTKNQV
jgi:hypothetical protein